MNVWEVTQNNLKPTVISQKQGLALSEGGGGFEVPLIVQSTLKRTTKGASKPPPPSDNAIPHKHSRCLQVPQNHLPHAARSIKTRPDSITTPTLTQS